MGGSGDSRFEASRQTHTGIHKRVPMRGRPLKNLARKVVSTPFP
ncbi:hypothetical protein NXF25_019878 [Crotalus adamanteus]|uniref:Uncharacterized protein n=1 Tax=Crotalus adamanteus TaxID=8729 RepID=A0AAW1B3M2_CROAD